MRRMKKSLLLAIAALCATMTFAITPEELADSLNVFASERAYLGKVKVSDIQIDEKNITVTTCNRLSCISLTPQEITQLKESVRQWVGGTPTATVSIISDGKELDEWVTALYKKRDKKLQYKMATAEVKNVSLCDLDTLVEVAAEKVYIAPEDKERLIQFRNNPSDESWMK